MGATSSNRSYSNYPKEILEVMVDSDREQDLCEYGHDTYSGTWGAKSPGVHFNSGLMNNYNCAVDFTWNHGEKWGVVEAIQYQGTINKKYSQDSRLLSLNEELENLKLDKKNMIIKFLEDRKEKRKTATCYSCKAKTDISKVTPSKTCPSCGKQHFYLSQTEVNKTKTQDKRIKSVQEKINARKRALHIDDKSIMKIEDELKTLTNKYVTITSQKKVKNVGMHTCKRCKSRINLDWVSNSDECPVCHNSFARTQKTDNSLSKIRTLSKELSEKTGIYWAVGGMCPC